MSIISELDTQRLECFRGLLLMVARAQIGPKYRVKFEPEEIVNQTLFDANRQRAEFRGTSEGELVAWLRKMLGNNIKDAIRYLHRDKRNIDKEQVPGADDWCGAYGRFVDVTCGWTSPSMRLIRHEREMQLADALERLPEAQREAVELHHLHGYTLTETADAIDRSEAAVVGLLRRGLKKLREYLKEKAVSDL